MKTHLLIAPAFVAHVLAQPVEPPPVVVAPAPPATVETTVTETVGPHEKVVEKTTVTKPAAFDPRRQLAIIPHAVAVPAVPPAEVRETTTTTRVGRVYNTERNVVIVEGRELAYVTLPVLFVKETAELLDAESREALDKTAAAILAVLQTDPTAMFDVEGHTSTDGEEDFNLNLSAARAKRIFDELTMHYRVPATALSAHGYGESYPMYPNGTEGEMILDRRVLVVRVK